MRQAPAESYTSVWNIPRLKATTLKGYRVTSVKIPSSDGIMSCSEKTALFGVHHLYYSHPQQLSFTGRTYLSSGRFSSYSVMDMNKLLHLESVASAMPRIMWWNSPGLFSLHFCILQTIKKLEVWCRRPGNEARLLRKQILGLSWLLMCMKFSRTKPPQS